MHECLKILHYRINFPTVFSITLISSTINYFISSAGASGFALRMHLLNKRGVSTSISITISVILTVFIYFTLGIIITQGIILYILEIKALNLRIVEGLIGVLVVFFIPFILTIIVYNHRFRNRWAIRIYYFVNETLYHITKYRIPKEDFRSFKNQLNNGIKILHLKKNELPKVAGYVLLDWIFNILVLYFAFRSVGINIPIPSLIIGFSFGMVMTAVPVLPSGLGLMELVLSTYYSNQGISTETALFASLVFRFFYYVIPFMISTILYYGIKIAEPQICLEKEVRNDSKLYGT